VRLFNVYKAEVEVGTQDAAMELSMDERYLGELTISFSFPGSSNTITMRVRELEMAIDGLKQRADPAKEREKKG
jgi:hypothetical protein